MQRLTLGRTDIEATGFVTIAGVIRTLPQIFGGGPTEDTQIGFEAPTNSARGNGVNLRGLGASSTLVLMNGRRLAGGGSEGLFVDVSNLPLAAVERMDILPDSSSTVYGADAVGGVVNFVMRDQFEGRQSEAYFGGATRGQLNESYLSQLVGGHWDRGHGMLAFDFYSRDNLPASDPLAGAQRPAAVWRRQFRSAASQSGNLIFGSRTWAIPAGQDGTQLRAGDLETRLTQSSESIRRGGPAAIPAALERLRVRTSGAHGLRDSVCGHTLRSARRSRQQRRLRCQLRRTRRQPFSRASPGYPRPGGGGL